MKRFLVASLAVGLLAACGAGNEHKGEHCVQSHQETVMVPITNTIPGANGTFTTYTTFIYEDETVCDKWVPDNPATVSHGNGKG